MLRKREGEREEREKERMKRERREKERETKPALPFKNQSFYIYLYKSQIRLVVVVASPHDTFCFVLYFQKKRAIYLNLHEIRKHFLSLSLSLPLMNEAVLCVCVCDYHEGATVQLLWRNIKCGTQSLSYDCVT